MFYEINGERFCTVLKDIDGEWIISYDNTKRPIFVSDYVLKTYKKIEIPDEINRNNLSEAERKRLEMINPLIQETECIRNSKLRKKIAEDISAKYDIRYRTILNLYFLFLAKKPLIKKKQKKRITLKKEEQFDNFDWAIKKYYYSAKRMSLQTVYDLLIMERYMDADGHIFDDKPSWYSFKHYFYDNNYHKLDKQYISRHGLSSYQRNKRPLFGQAMKWKNKVGNYQMDATIADIYLVSRHDHKTIIGRPNIYIAVDTITQLIAGVYIGFESNRKAVMLCLANASMNKTEYCKSLGITIEKEDWPSEGLPGTIITDQGSEFIHGIHEELFSKYGLESEILPPFRPDEKSLVEKTFDIIQSKYKSLLRGKGVVEKDSKERWAYDYKKQAILDLDEFTKIIVNIVIYLNSKRVLSSYILDSDMIENKVLPIPNQLWNWYDKQNQSSIIPINERKLYYMSLDTKKASIGRKGILHNGIYYQNKNISSIIKKIKNQKDITIAYDTNNLNNIFLFHNNEYIKFTMIHDEILNLNQNEYQLIKENIKKQINVAKKQELESRILLLKETNEIIKEAEFKNK